MVKFAITLFCAQVVNLDFDAEAVPAGEESGWYQMAMRRHERFGV